MSSTASSSVCSPSSYASSLTALGSRAPSLPPLDLPAVLLVDGTTLPKLFLPSSLSSFSLGMGSFSGSGHDSFTIADGFFQTAGGYGFPRHRRPNTNSQSLTN
jgi:hypothetical protein